MLSVAILDFIQMIVVIGGLLYIAYAISQLTGGIVPVIESASINHKLDFFPKGNIWTWITFFGTWITMMLGSVPQQDVFQRVTSAKTAVFNCANVDVNVLDVRLIVLLVKVSVDDVVTIFTPSMVTTPAEALANVVSVA